MPESTIPESEIWRPIPLTEGRYEASSLGRIRTVERVVAAGPGRKGHRTVRTRVLKAGANPNRGYLHVLVSAEDGKPFLRDVHRLVADAFFGPCPAGWQVNHKDGDRQNNRPENLEYVTQSENHLHAFRVLGRRNGREKLSGEQVAEIRSRHEAGETNMAALGRCFGISKAQARRIVQQIQRAKRT